MAKRKWTENEVEEYRKTHGDFFYCNKEDSNFLIPKAFGFGKTVNWGNPITWIAIVALIILIVLRKLVFK